MSYSLGILAARSRGLFTALLSFKEKHWEGYRGELGLQSQRPARPPRPSSPDTGAQGPVGSWKRLGAPGPCRPRPRPPRHIRPTVPPAGAAESPSAVAAREPSPEGQGGPGLWPQRTWKTEIPGKQRRCKFFGWNWPFASSSFPLSRPADLQLSSPPGSPQFCPISSQTRTPENSKSHFGKALAGPSALLSRVWWSQSLRGSGSGTRQPSQPWGGT